jgi:hypothetical protein
MLATSFTIDARAIAVQTRCLGAHDARLPLRLAVIAGGLGRQRNEVNRLSEDRCEHVPQAAAGPVTNRGIQATSTPG